MTMPTDASEQNNIGPLGGPVINAYSISVNFHVNLAWPVEPLDSFLLPVLKQNLCEKMVQVFYGPDDLHVVYPRGSVH